MNPSTIQLNGQTIGYKHVKARLTKELPEWEKEIFMFLSDWFSESDHIMVSTSGSTGKPKLISRKKEQLIASAQMTGEFFDLKPNQSALLCLPAKYIAGKMMLVRAILWRLDLWYIEPKITLEFPAKKRYYFSAMTPQQVEANMTDINKFDILIIGGAPINPSLEEKLKSSSAKLFATYGMTETVSHIALREITENGNSIYSALPHVAFSADERGCLMVSAPKIISATLTTNDLVTLQSPTQFTWQGRADFAINSGGIKIIPEQVERKLTNLIPYPFFIYGEDDEKWGQRVVLLIESEQFPTEEFLRKLSVQLPSLETPHSILFRKKFIRSENGKLKREASFNEPTSPK